MINSQHIMKNTTLVVLAAVLVIAASLSMVAFADEHDERNVVDYNVDDVDNPDVPFKSLVEVTGTDIGTEEDYVLYYSEGDYVSFGEYTSNSDGVLELDTLALDREDDPRGQYTIADAATGSVVAPSTQQTNGGAIEIGSTSSNTDYVVAVYETDASGDIDMSSELGSEEFEATEELSSYALSLDTTMSSTGDVGVVIYDQAVTPDNTGDLLDSQIVNVDDVSATDPTGTTVNTVTNNRFTADWTLVNDMPEGDERIDHDAFDSVVADRVWVGQEVIFADDDTISVGETYDLEKVVEDDDNQFITQITAEESDTVNNYELSVNSSFSEVSSVEDPTGEFQIVDDGTVIKSWNAQEQELNSEANETYINLNTDNTQAEINVTSTRAGPYDVYVESGQLNATELMDLIDEGRLDSEMSVHRVYIDEDDDGVEDELDEQRLRISELRTSGSNPATIPLDFQSSTENTYEFMFNVTDSTAESEMTGEEAISAEVGSTAEATFDKVTYTQEQGDTVEMTINMEGATEAVLNMSDSNYDLDFVVKDVNADGEVTLEFDTYRAGDYESLTVADVFNATGDDEIEGLDGRAADDIDLPAVSGPFGTGVYTVELYVNDQDTDLSALNIVERESVNINTWVLPQDRQPNLDDLSEYGTQQEHVAEQDWFVVEVEASGLFSDTLLTNETQPYELINYDRHGAYNSLSDYDSSLDASDDTTEFNMHIEEADPERNQEATHIKVEEAEELKLDAENDKFYLFFDTGNSEIYDTFDVDFDHIAEGEDGIDEDTEFDIDFNVTEDYKYVDEDDLDEDNPSANLHENVTFVEREILPQLPSVTMDEETLDTRHGVAVSENTTITGKTHIAPYTRHIDIQLRDEPGTTNSTVEFEDENQTVSEEGTISATFDTSSLNLGRLMTLEFETVTERKEVVLIEAQAPPEITNVSVNTPVTDGSEVNFDVDVDSFDEESVTYQWDLGDDSTSGLQSPTHVYDGPGTYTAEVTATDSAGQTATETVEVLVEEAPNQPPTVEQVIAPTELEVDESGSFGVFGLDDNDQGNLTYEWNMDDGTTLTGSSVEHAFSVSGVYDVESTVLDSNGESTTETVTVQVTGDQANETDSGNEFSVTAVDSETDENVPSVSFTIAQGGEEVETITTDTDGVASTELESGDYTVSADVDGYESYSQNITIEESGVDFNAVLVAENAGEDGGDGEDDPSQPGFTVVLAAISMIVGSVIYRRRQ